MKFILIIICYVIVVSLSLSGVTYFRKKKELERE